MHTPPACNIASRTRCANAILPSSGGYSRRAVNATPLFISNVSFSSPRGSAELLFLPDRLLYFFCFFLRGHGRVGQMPRNTFKANARRTSTEGRYKDHLMTIACGLAGQCLSTTSPCLLRRATPLFISSVAPAASPSFFWP